MGPMGRAGLIFLGAMTAATALLRAVALQADETAPKLRYIEEYTNTTDIRDIAVFEGKVWTATEGGIAVYDQQDGHFLFKLTSRRGLFGNSVQRLVPSSRGTLLTAGDFGAAEISRTCEAPNKSCFISAQSFPTDRFNPAMDIVSNRDGDRLLGYQSGFFPLGATPTARLDTGMWRTASVSKEGIVVGGMDGRLMLRRTAETTPSLLLTLDKPVLHMRKVKEGTLILAGSDLLLVENNRTRPVLFGSKRIAASALSRDGARVLVGTSTGEVFEYRNRELVHMGEADCPVTAILSDGDTVWLGLSKKGLYRLKQHADTAVPAPGAPGEICSNHITQMTVFNKMLIAGTFDNGACALVNGEWQMLEGADKQYVHGAASDGHYLWVATSNGLLRYDAGLNPLPLNDTDPKEVRWFAASAVTALAETDDGIALGSPWGVIRVKRDGETLSATFISRFRGAPEHLTSIVRAPGGLLVSSETQGVRFVGKNRKETRAYLDPVHLPEAWILDVAQGETGFWAAACQHGVSYVTGEKAAFIDTSKGLADNRTISVAPYKQGAFVATLGGLSYARTDGTATAPFAGRLPDPRSAMVFVQRSRLYLGTESGTAVFTLEK